jgi:uridine phosphorylase
VIDTNHFVPHHLAIGAAQVAGNGVRGRVFFLPGSDGRARMIADAFLDLEVVPSDRQLNVYLGRLEDGGTSVDVGAVSSGMGCPSLDIVATELVLLGARTLIRVGTAGSMQPQALRAGDLVIASAAVRDEGASDDYAARGYPAVADRVVVAALERAAVACGHADRTFTGVVHSKDTLFGRELGLGPRSGPNAEATRQLQQIGVLASEMESAHLFVLSHVHSSAIAPIAAGADPGRLVRSGAVLAVVGDHGGFAEPAVAAPAVARAIDVALRGALELCR